MVVVVHETCLATTDRRVDRPGLKHHDRTDDDSGLFERAKHAVSSVVAMPCQRIRRSLTGPISDRKRAGSRNIVVCNMMRRADCKGAVPAAPDEPVAMRWGVSPAARELGHPCYRQGRWYPTSAR